MIRLVIILSVLSISPAYSYVDPGSGSMLIQAVMAAGLGGLMFFKQIKFAIVGFVSKKTNKNQDSNTENDDKNTVNK
jgi:hypothetical protein